MSRLVAIFCDIDDFCNGYDLSFAPQILPSPYCPAQLTYL